MLLNSVYVKLVVTNHNIGTIIAHSINHAMQYSACLSLMSYIRHLMSYVLCLMSYILYKTAINCIALDCLSSIIYASISRGFP